MIGTKIKIREAKKSELKEVADLQTKLAKHERKFDKKIKIGTKTNNVKYLKHFVLKKCKGKIFVAFDGGKMIGYCDGWFGKTKQYTFDKIGYVSDCFVLERYRRKGVGSRLLKELLKWLKEKNVKHVKMDVYLKNKDAYKLWKFMGFKETTISMRKVIR